jgi:hypothetical protein
MKKLLLVSIFFSLAIVVPMPTMARVDINAGIPLPPTIVFEARPEVIMMPDASGVFVVADADEDTPKDRTTGKDEKQQGQPLETAKPGPENKPILRINVWPQPTDNMQPPSVREEENYHKPPDRF